MASPTPAALKAEILSGPYAATFASWVAAGAHAPIADWLNSLDSAGAATLVQPLDVGPLLIWAALTGVRHAVEATIQAGTAAAQVLAACLAVRDAIGGGAPTLDLTNPAIAGTGGLLDVLTSAGVLTATGTGSRDDLIAQGTRACSRAEALWGAGTVIAHLDVAAALNS